MIVIENPETGAEMILEPLTNGRYPSFLRPWRLKSDTPPTPARIAGPTEIQERAERRAEIRSYWANYPYRKCSSCGERGVYEST